MVKSLGSQLPELFQPSGRKQKSRATKSASSVMGETGHWRRLVLKLLQGVGKMYMCGVIAQVGHLYVGGGIHEATGEIMYFIKNN